MSAKNILISKREHKALLEDKARVDYLEKVMKRGTIKMLGMEFDVRTFLGSDVGTTAASKQLRSVLDTYISSDTKF